jgi:hypothetical protein
MVEEEREGIWKGRFGDNIIVLSFECAKTLLRPLFVFFYSFGSPTFHLVG